MDTLIYHLKKHALLRGIIYVLLGIAVVVNPSGVFNITVYVISGYLAFMGLLDLIEGIRVRQKEGIYDSSFVLGILLLVLAGIVLVFSKAIVSILPIFLGLLVVTVGSARLIQSFNLRKYTTVNWGLLSFYGIVLIIGGGLLIFNPFRSVLFLFQLFGGILIFMGISECLTFFQLRKIEH
ncbi:HdeD family acid-resistance protein [Enterococcus sp. LJL128]|uniref:HdeD family acid-resistance protein n=1 Tax=Enterococcus sp. LJL51 TaxID=3416656 RepID=UPI003CEC796F